MVDINASASPVRHGRGQRVPRVQPRVRPPHPSLSSPLLPNSFRSDVWMILVRLIVEGDASTNHLVAFISTEPDRSVWMPIDVVTDAGSTSRTFIYNQ